MNLGSVGSANGTQDLEQVRESLARVILAPSTRSKTTSQESSSLSSSPQRDLKPRRFSVVSESPRSASSPALARTKKSGSQKLPSRSTSRRGSFSESDISPLLKREEDLTGAIEILKSTASNFRFLSLRVPENLSVTDFFNSLLAELKAFKEAVDAERPCPSVQGKTVPDIDIKSFWNFAGQVLHSQEWTQVFYELIEKMDEERKQGVFLSPRERESLARVQYKEEADQLAEHLMSKCTDMDSGVRIVNLTELQRLLIDQRIKAFPIMIEPIKDAAAKVMEQAIRDCQVSILFSAAKAAQADTRKISQLWREKAKEFPNAHLDLAGITCIAKSCKIKITVLENKNDKEQQDLAKLIALKIKIDEVLKLFLEEAVRQ